MTNDEREELRREWKRLQSVDAKVIEVRRSRSRLGRIGWFATIESALDRRASASARTPGGALRKARCRLGYRDHGDTLALAGELPEQLRI